MSGGSPSPWRRAARALHRGFVRGPIGRVLERGRQRRALATWGPDDEARAGFYATFVPAAGLCFDVGANVGNRTKVFLRLGARVVAIEPQPACAALLRRAWPAEPRLTILEQALGATPGEAELRLSDASTLSSMSADWIEAVRASGRFDQYRWDRVLRVPVTTLDALIAEYGVPAFVKVDVEGFELEVLRGLSRPVGALSIEFTPECAATTLACIERLDGLGTARFNYSEGESMRLGFADWTDRAGLAAHLERLRGDASAFGDVYARFGA